MENNSKWSDNNIVLYFVGGRIMINHKFIQIKMSFSEMCLDIDNFQEDEMIRISDKFVRKYAKVFNEMESISKCIGETHTGLSDGIKILKNQFLEELEDRFIYTYKDTTPNVFEDKEFRKFIDFLGVAIINNYDIIHIAP